MGNLYQSASYPLPTRDYSAHTASQDATLGATYNRIVTSSALAGDVALRMVDPTLYPGLDFEVTHRGEFVTRVYDFAGRILWESQVDGSVATFINDGVTWFLTGLQGVAPPVPAMRVWSLDAGAYRQATSHQDVIDSLNALVRALIVVMGENNVRIPDSLEAFNGNLG